MSLGGNSGQVPNDSDEDQTYAETSPIEQRTDASDTRSPCSESLSEMNRDNSVPATSVQGTSTPRPTQELPADTESRSPKDPVELKDKTEEEEADEEEISTQLQATPKQQTSFDSEGAPSSSPQVVPTIAKVKFREDSDVKAPSLENPEHADPNVSLATAEVRQEPKRLPREVLAAAKTQDGLPRPEGGLGDLSSLGVVSEETIISNESFVQTRGRAWSRKVSGMTVDSRAIIKERFSAFAQNYTLCYGLAEGLPRSMNPLVIDLVIALARFSGTEGTVVTHMLLKEYLRAMKKNEAHTFMRGNSFAPLLVDRVTSTSLMQLLTPTVEDIADQVTAINSTNNPELAEGLDKLTDIPIMTSTPPQCDVQPDDEPEVSSNVDRSGWVKALLEFVTNILENITKAIDETSHDPSVAPFYHSIAELIRVATIIDRKWAVPESRFMDSTVLSAYPETSASGRNLKSLSKDDLSRMIEKGAESAVADRDRDKTSCSPDEADQSGSGDNEKKDGTVVNEDHVDSMLSTLIMLRVLGPMMATKSVEVLRSASHGGDADPLTRSGSESDESTEKKVTAEEARRGQKRMVAIAKLLQKAANRRLYDAPHEEHLKEINRYLPSLSKRLHSVLRRTTKPMFKRQQTATEEHPETELLAREKSFAFHRSPSGRHSSGSPSGRSGCLQHVAPSDDIETIWGKFQSCLRSFWLPISHSMLEIQPLFVREHASQIDKVSDLYHEHCESFKRSFANLKVEYADLREQHEKASQDAKAKSGKGLLGFFKSGQGISEEEKYDLQVLRDKLDQTTKTLNYHGLVYHGYRRLRRLLKGDQYYIALPSGLTRHGHSCVMVYGDQIGIANSQYQSRAHSVRAASADYLPTYPNHQKFNDLHIAADVAAAVHLASCQPEEVARKRMAEAAAEISEFDPMAGQESSEVGDHDTKTWSRRVCIVFVPSTDNSHENNLGPTWLFQMLGTVFPSHVLGLIDRVVVTQQASRLSRYSVMLSNFGKKAGALVGGKDEGTSTTGRGRRGSLTEGSTTTGGGTGGESPSKQTSTTFGETEETIVTNEDSDVPASADTSNHSLVFKFADTFGEALSKAGLDAHAVSLPTCLPYADLKGLLRYQQMMDWKKRAHRGMYSVLPMLLDSIALLQMHGTRSAFRESFLSISKAKSLEDFACQPFIRRRRLAHQDKITEISSKNLVHLTILNPNNKPEILETNHLLFGIRFCHNLCLHLDTYRSEDWSARSTAELKALPGLSLVHSITDLRQRKAAALGLIGEKTIDIDVSHELTQLLVFISLQQHHVSGAYEWRERLTQIAWELYYRFYSTEDHDLLSEFANHACSDAFEGNGQKAAGEKLPVPLSSDSDPAMWIDISGDETEQPVPLDATVTLQDSHDVATDGVNFFNVPTIDLGNPNDDAPTLRRGISAVLRHKSTKRLLHESRYLAAVKEFFGRNYDVWGVFRKDEDESVRSLIPEDSMLNVIHQRRHVLLYDRFMIETFLLLARRALESVVGPDGSLAQVDLTNPEALKNTDVQNAIKSVQKLLFVKSIDWWKPTGPDEPSEADWETATFVLVWTLMRKHRYVFGAERLLNAPAYEALLSGWR